jgi:ribosomal protein S11
MKQNFVLATLPLARGTCLPQAGEKGFRKQKRSKQNFAAMIKNPK